MAKIFGVMTFKKKGRSLQAGQPRSAKTADAAITLAEQLAAANDGIIAYAQNVDIEADIYDAPEILFRHGQVSPELDA